MRLHLFTPAYNEEKNELTNGKESQGEYNEDAKYKFRIGRNSGSKLDMNNLNIFYRQLSGEEIEKLHDEYNEFS